MNITIGVWFVVFCVCLIFLLFHNGIKRLKESAGFDDDFITGVLSTGFALTISTLLILTFA